MPVRQVWRSRSGVVTRAVVVVAVGAAVTAGGISKLWTSPDTSPPAVFITAPLSGTVSGTQTITATAGDNVGVTGVTFQDGGVNACPEDTTAPFTCQWDTTAVPNGAHTLTAIAYDAAGNTATSTAASVTVSGGLTPGGGCTLSDATGCSSLTGKRTITINDASAKDAAGVVIDCKTDINSYTPPAGATLTNPSGGYPVKIVLNFTTAQNLDGVYLDSGCTAAGNSNTHVAATGNVTSGSASVTGLSVNTSTIPTGSFAYGEIDVNGNLLHSDSTITGIASTTGIAAGELAAGPGIIPGTTVSSVTASTVVLSAPSGDSGNDYTGAVYHFFIVKPGSVVTSVDSSSSLTLSRPAAVTGTGVNLKFATGIDCVIVINGDGRNTGVRQDVLKIKGTAHDIVCTAVLNAGPRVGAPGIDGTGNTVSGSTVVSNVVFSNSLGEHPSLATLKATDGFSGTGIPAKTTVVSADNNAGTVTLSQAATSTATGVSVHYTTSNAHQDCVQFQGGYRIGLVDVTCGDWTNKHATVEGAGGALFFSTAGGVWADDVDVIRMHGLACNNAFNENQTTRGTNVNWSNGIVKDSAFRQGDPADAAGTLGALDNQLGIHVVGMCDNQASSPHTNAQGGAGLVVSGGVSTDSSGPATQGVAWPGDVFDHYSSGYNAGYNNWPN